VAAAFRPLRRRMQILMDRRFNRRRYDAQATVHVFATVLRAELDLRSCDPPSRQSCPTPCNRRDCRSGWRSRSRPARVPGRRMHRHGLIRSPIGDPAGHAGRGWDLPVLDHRDHAQAVGAGSCGSCTLGAGDRAGVMRRGRCQRQLRAGMRRARHSSRAGPALGRRDRGVEGVTLGVTHLPWSCPTFRAASLSATSAWS
jgi:hypothetical protein